MPGPNLNLALKISALVEGVDKIRELAKAISDATKGQSSGGSTKATDELASSAKAAADATKELAEATNKSTKETKDAKKPTEEQGRALEDLNDTVNKAVRGLKFLAGGFLALKSVQIAKDLADTAARTETLGVVFNTVGRNLGYTSDQLADADKQVQKLGITASASREALTKLLQSGLDLSFGAKLARAAQDLAVVTGENSSQTLTRLITNIQQMDTTGLRFMGLVIDREAVMQKAANETGKAISGTAAKVVFANAVLAEATKLNGIYEESMSTVGKQLTSMPRYIENFKVALGNNLLPVYFELVKAGIKILDSLGQLARAASSTGASVDRLHSSLEQGAEAGGLLAESIRGVADVLSSFILFVKDNLEVFKSLLFYLSAIWAAFKALAIIEAIVAGLGPLLAGLGFFVGMVSSALAALSSLAAAGAAAAGVLLAALGPVGAVIGAIVIALGAAYAAYKLFSDKGAADTGKLTLSLKEVQQAVNDYTASLEKQSKLRSDMLSSALAEATLRNKLVVAESSGDTKRIAEAKAALDLQVKKTDGLKKEFAAEKERGALLDKKLTQAQAEKQITDQQYDQIKATKERLAATEKAINLERIAREELAKSLKDAGIDFAEYSSGVSSDFNAAVDGVTLGAANIALEGVNAADAVRTLTERLEQLAQKTKTPEELERFAKALREVQEAATKAQQEGKITPAEGISAALAARIKAQADAAAAKAKREREAGGAAALSQANALANAIQDAIVSHVKNIADLTKTQGDRSLAEASRQYDLGLISTEQYYRRKLQAAIDSGDAELAVEDATLKALRVKRAQATDPAAAKSAETAITNQQAKIEQLRLKQLADREAIQGDLDAKRIASLKEVTDLNLKNAAAQDETDLITQIAIINREYEDRIIALKALGDVQQEAALNQEKAAKINAARLAIDNKLLERRAQLVAADLDQQQARLALAQKNGQITDVEAQNASNEIIQRRIASVQEQRKAVSELLAREQASLKEGSGASVQSVQALSDKLTEFDTQILQLSAGTKTYAESIRTNFTDALAQGIDAVLEKGESVGKALQGIFSSLRSQITQIVAKDLAQKGVRLLVELTGGQGNSVFDKLGGLLGDKRGDSALNPLYVTMAGKDAASSFVGPLQEKGSIFDGLTDKIGDTFNQVASFVTSIFSDVGGSISSLFGSLFGGGAGGGGGLLSLAASFFGFSRGGSVGRDGTPVRRMAFGGHLRGPGGPTADLIPLWASNGEYIVNAAAVKQWGVGFLDFVNGSASRPTEPAYAEGGPVARFPGVRGDMSTLAAGSGVRIDKLVNQIDSRTDTGQVQQLVAQGVRDGIRQYDAKLRAEGRIKG